MVNYIYGHGLPQIGCRTRQPPPVDMIGWTGLEDALLSRMNLSTMPLARAKDPQEQHQISQTIESIAREIACFGQGLETRQVARKLAVGARLAQSIRKLIRDALGAASLQKNSETRSAKSPGS